MSTVLRASGAPLPQATSGGWLRGFGMRHVAIAVCSGILLPLAGAALKLATGSALQPAPLVEDAVAGFVLALGALLSVLATDNRLGGRLGPAPRVAIATLAGAILGTVLIEVASRLVLRPLGFPSGDSEAVLFVGEVHRVAFRFAGAATWSLVLVVLFALLEERRRATQRLHTVRVVALAAEREVVEGELQAMQARVDPEALFTTLLEIDRAYAASTASGEQALDALIASLREAKGRSHA